MPADTTPGLLADVKVVEIAHLSPDGVGQHLADLGAQVTKVEHPERGDEVRTTGWPMVDGASLLHWHWNRGKRSVTLDLADEADRGRLLDLVATADVLIEGMRTGALARRGLDPDTLHAVNPCLVVLSVAGFGSDGRLANLGSHGVTYDAYAGLAEPVERSGYPSIPPHTQVGTHAGVVYAAFAALAGLTRARATGQGCRIEVAQADAAVYWNWMRIESHLAAERAGVDPRPLGPESMWDAARYQYYETADGQHVLFMATERRFWERFCSVVGRPDIVERFGIGEEVSENAHGAWDLRAELAKVFRGRTAQDWVTLALEHDIPITPTHTATDLLRDPDFARRAHWLDAEEYGAQMLPLPIRVDGRAPRPRGRAPDHGQHDDEILGAVTSPSQETSNV